VVGLILKGEPETSLEYKIEQDVRKESVNVWLCYNNVGL